MSRGMGYGCRSRGTGQGCAEWGCRAGVQSGAGHNLHSPNCKGKGERGVKQMNSNCRPGSGTWEHKSRHGVAKCSCINSMR